MYITHFKIFFILKYLNDAHFKANKAYIHVCSCKLY